MYNATSDKQEIKKLSQTETRHVLSVRHPVSNNNISMQSYHSRYNRVLVNTIILSIATVFSTEPRLVANHS